MVKSAHSILAETSAPRLGKKLAFAQESDLHFLEGTGTLRSRRGEIFGEKPFQKETGNPCPGGFVTKNSSPHHDFRSTFRLSPASPREAGLRYGMSTIIARGAANPPVGAKSARPPNAPILYELQWISPGRLLPVFALHGRNA